MGQGGHAGPPGSTDQFSRVTPSLQTERRNMRSVDSLIGAIERAMPALLAAHDVDGAAVGIVYGGKPTYRRGFGVASVTTGAPYTADTTVSQQVFRCMLPGVGTGLPAGGGGGGG